MNGNKMKITSQEKELAYQQIKKKPEEPPYYLTTHGRIYENIHNAVDSQCLENRRNNPDILNELNGKRERGLDYIAKEIQHWLDFHEKNCMNSNIAIEDSMHVGNMPVYPDRGTLKLWIKTLRNL